MKKKILVSILSLCLCVLSLLGLAGCKDPLSMPNSLSVTSNGGAVVRVGEYLYFTNGYRDISTLKYGDNRKNIKQGAIYRVKLGENNGLEYDDNGNMKGAEKIVDNIAGFSSLNLFVYDNYIYYSTPFSEPDKQGNTQFDRTVIKRARLNGENEESLFISDSKTALTWSVNKIITKEKSNTKEQVVVSVLDGDKLICINVSKDSTKTIANGVSSVVFPTVNEYNPESKSATNINETFIYYSRTEDGITGNAVYRASLVNLTEEETPVINENDGTTYALTHLQKFDTQLKLYYSKTKDSSTKFFGTEIDAEGSVLFSSRTKQYTSTKYSQVEFAVSGRDEAIVVSESGSGEDATKEVHFVNGVETRAEVEANITILAIDENYIYGFNKSNHLVKISLDASHTVTTITDFANEKDDNEKEIEDGKENYYSAGINSEKTNKNLFVDFDGDYMYFFRTFKNNDGKESVYLARVNLTISDAEIETVGQMEEGHKYTVQKTETENE